MAPAEGAPTLRPLGGSVVGTAALLTTGTARPSRVGEDAGEREPAANAEGMRSDGGSLSSGSCAAAVSTFIAYSDEDVPATWARVAPKAMPPPMATSPATSPPPREDRVLPAPPASVTSGGEPRGCNAVSSDTLQASDDDSSPALSLSLSEMPPPTPAPR